MDKKKIWWAMLQLKGAPVAERVLSLVREGAQHFLAATGTPIRLEILTIGQDLASQVYVARKEKVAQSVGICVEHMCFPENVPEEIMYTVLEKARETPACHGVILQLPLPVGHDIDAYMVALGPEKDVDGLHPMNPYVADLWPCTPLGCVALLEGYGRDIAYVLGREDIAFTSRHLFRGMHCVVVGRSRLVGAPLAQLLLAKDATVTIAHSKTRDLALITRTADMVFLCAGCLDILGPEDVKEGAIIVDVGIHRTVKGIRGDASPDHRWAEKSAAMTPVPGGVGPMTVAFLMWNTFQAACHQTQQMDLFHALAARLNFTG